jgi:hypothetical protein
MMKVEEIWDISKRMKYLATVFEGSGDPSEVHEVIGIKAYDEEGELVASFPFMEETSEEELSTKPEKVLYHGTRKEAYLLWPSTLNSTHQGFHLN